VPARTAADVTARMTASSSPTSRHGAESDSSDTLAATDIAPQDWDLLFRAALELLARLADEKAAPVGTGAGWQAPGTVLSECLDALDQLRRAVPAAHCQQMSEATYTDCGHEARVCGPPSGSDR
ncbi:MAG: hypothetical protein Q8L92_00370, partial [Rubrivivax sp.]|nr:hypothetical protein [Rubrivivax sp.]